MAFHATDTGSTPVGVVCGARPGLGPVAQSVEQRTFNPWVVGSIPTGLILRALPRALEGPGMGVEVARERSSVIVALDPLPETSP